MKQQMYEAVNGLVVLRLVIDESVNPQLITDSQRIVRSVGSDSV